MQTYGNTLYDKVTSFVEVQGSINISVREKQLGKLQLVSSLLHEIRTSSSTDSHLDAISLLIALRSSCKLQDVLECHFRFLSLPCMNQSSARTSDWYLGGKGGSCRSLSLIKLGVGGWI
jgi:hypothetical protein